MRTLRLFWITLLLSSVPAFGAGDSRRAPPAAKGTSSADVRAAYGHLPLGFEPNQGQTDRRVRFLAHGQGYTLFLTADEAVLALRRSAVNSQESGEKDDGQRTTNSVLRMKLVGTNQNVIAAETDRLPGKSNYFIDNDPKRWLTDVPNYARVKYPGIYSGVDLVYYGNQGQLEYDFVVAPGADPGAIRFALSDSPEVGKQSGAGSQSKSQGLRSAIDSNGDLLVQIDGNVVRFQKPTVYQPGPAGQKHYVDAGYRLESRQPGARNQKCGIRFRLGSYDHRRTLVIDPVLIYSTYLGGSGGDVAYGVGVDSSFNAYVAGITSSTNFPTLTPEQGSSGGNGDGFISKLNPDGTALVYSTYLGGSGADGIAALAVDSKADVFVTGQTTSTDFPTTPTKSSSSPSSPVAFQTTYGGNGDAFVTELASTGSSLVYSSYLGGSGADFGQGIAVDSTGNAYVTGSTQSPDFPIPTGTTPFQSALAGSSDAFAVKVNFSGTALTYSTYLGGSAADTGQGIQVDSSGNAYIAGYTFSSDFPILNALYDVNAGNADAFVTELNPTGASLVFSTYLGGSGRDRAFGIALDKSANIYVAGDTQSTDFPTTTGAFQTTYGGNGDAFAAELTAGGKSLTYSTFIGGSGTDQGNGIALDSSGDAFVVGFTQSSDFPTVDSFQAVLGLTGGSSCGTSPCADAFVTELNPTGSKAVYSSYLGGSGADFGQAVAVDSTGDPYLAGSTSSNNFPAIAGVYQGELGGVAGNAFVAKVDAADSPAIALAPAKINFGNETVSVSSSTQAVTVIDAGSAPLEITSITPPSSDFTESDNCVGTVAARGGSCTINITFTPIATGLVTDQFSIADNAAGSPHIITVTGTGVTQATAVTVAPTSLTFPNTYVSSVSSAQTVTITNTGVATLNITQISTSGDFTQTNTCAALLNVLNVGQSCSVSVTFAPTASGSRTGALSISDNATGSPQSVALSGNALALFSVGASSTTSSVLIGATTATFTMTASAVKGFTGAISFSCATSVSCSFASASIFAGQTNVLTVSGLSASTANPFNFTVTGTSGSQTATVNLSVLFQSYALTGSPALVTVVAGSPANYTVVVTPLNGFNQQVNMTCTGTLPIGSACSFSPSSTTPNGTSPSTVSLSIMTTQSSLGWPRGPGRIRPPRPMLVLGAVWLLLTLVLFMKRRQLERRGAPSLTFFAASRTAAVGFLLLLLLLLGSCRGTTSSTAPTPTGNYIITITGSLNSNTAVQETTTVDLAIT
ncbi:MAG TPA: SBBP repeat-containing protein [Terriglobia bacterium]